MEKITVGIVGFGLSGKVFHARLLKAIPEFIIKSIVTTREEHLIEIHDEFPEVSVVSHIDDLLTDPDIQLVIIATSNTSHFQLAKQCMLAGKHVIVEKPFTVSTHEALLLLELQRETGMILSIYQNRRFDGDFLTVTELINKDALGRLVEFESHFDRFRMALKENAWREQPLPGSGILFDLGAHLIDQALYLFGLPLEVYADISKQRRGDTDDSFEIILYYSELKVTLKAGMLVNVPLPRFILHGTEGSFIKYGLDVQEDDLKAGKDPNDHDWGVELEMNHGILNTFKKEIIPTLPGDYKRFYQNIYDAITRHKELEISPQDGFNVIRIIEAAIHSHTQKKRIEIIH